MDRAQKEQVVEELGQIFASSGVVVVAHYEGMTVAEMQDLRAQMREAGGAVRVAKNRLAKIALDGKPAASIADYLTGMTVLAFSDDPVARNDFGPFTPGFRWFDFGDMASVRAATTASTCAATTGSE